MQDNARQAQKTSLTRMLKCSELFPRIPIQSKLNSLLIVRQRQRANAAVTNGECIERSQVECTPHFDDALVAGCHQIFSVARQQHALDSVKGKEIDLLIWHSSGGEN